MREHLHNLGCVLGRLREAGLRVKPSKPCHTPQYVLGVHMTVHFRQVCFEIVD